MIMKDFKEFVQLEEGLKPEHGMRPGWMIKADPVLKAKIAANKAKQKEIKSLMGQKLKEEALEEDMHDEAEKHKDKASKALETSDMMAHHHHMADYHDALSQWHDSKGRGRAAQEHADKSEQHADKYTALARKAKGVKEESEQIDELSKETLKSYVDKVSTTAPRGKTQTGVLKSIKAIGGVTKAIRKQYSSK